MSRAPEVIGVVGAGTMGAGIAQLACLAGAHTLLHDPVGEALDRGAEAVRTALARGAERGRCGLEEAGAAADRLEPADSLEGLAPSGLVIEAAPESLAVKHVIFERLSALVAPEAVLATNTSSLPVTAIAAAASHPERVVGMHFFNPAPVMRLLEVVAGEESGEHALAVARATGEAMGKRVILAADGPGFLVNRCNRPFGLEALRLVQERVATMEVVDRICRMGGGFPMGPFELADLVGVDVALDVARSFYEQSFGEPRWRPSPIAARMVAAGRRGRKAGRGYYDYRSGPHRPEDPAPPAAGGGRGLVVVAGEGTLAYELHDAAAAAGYEAAWPGEREGEVPELIVDVLPPFEETRVVELTRTSTTADAAVQEAQRFFATLGKHVEWVGDAPGLVLGRIVCQVINEAAFALGEGLGSAEDIDAGMLLGLNHPHGTLGWADLIGLEHVLAVLDGLADEYREERYRAAPLLRRLVWEGRLGRQTGAGFLRHEG